MISESAREALSVRKNRTSGDSRLQATDAAARSIMQSEETERAEKSARLAALRLARDAQAQKAAAKQPEPALQQAG